MKDINDMNKPWNPNITMIYTLYIRAKKRMIFTPLNILNAGFYNKIDYK